MSLQVWLPLNGNLENQGVADVIPSIQNGTATYNDSGKIGKCFYNSSTGSNIIIPYDFYTTNQLSIAFWIKPNSPSAWMDLFSIGQYANRMETNSTSGTLYYWYNDNNSYGIATSSQSLFSITDSVWTHIACTIDGSYINIYKNGVLTKTLTQIGTISNAIGNNPYIYIGRRRPSESSYYQGYFNDIRIYDHCLSPKEVKEISKGLCLHYKLNGIGQENLYEDSQTLETKTYSTGWYKYMGSLFSVDNGILHVAQTGTTSNVWQMYSPRRDSLLLSSFEKEDYLTFSADIKWVSGTPSSNQLVYLNTWDTLTHRCGWSGLSGYSDLSQIIAGQWGKITAKIPISLIKSLTNTTGTAYTIKYFDITISLNRDGEYYLKNPKLERGSVVTSWIPNSADTSYTTLGYNLTTEFDCSGFGNDGTKRYLPNSNYVTNSSFVNNTSNWGGVNGSTITISTIDNRKTITATKGTTNYLYNQSTTISHTAGTNQIFTFSAEIYSTETQTIYGGIWINSSGWQSAGSFTFDNSSIQIGWNNVKATISVTTSSYSGAVIFAIGCSGTTLNMYHPKIEYASVSTEWIPNTSDSDYNSYVSNLNFKPESESARYLTSYDFPDSCNRMISRTQLDFLNEATFSCWIKQKSYSRTSGTTTGSGNQFIISQGRDYLDTNNYNTYGMNIVSQNGTLIGLIGLISLSSNIKVTLNTWYHVALSWDGTTAKIYVNGILKNSATTSRVLWTNNSGAFTIGKMAHGYTGSTTYFPFVGNISDARIYATALSADDILELYHTSAMIDNQQNLFTYELMEE